MISKMLRVALEGSAVVAQAREHVSALRARMGRLKRRNQQHERRVAARLTGAERDQLIGLLEKLTT